MVYALNAGFEKAETVAAHLIDVLACTNPGNMVEWLHGNVEEVMAVVSYTYQNYPEARPHVIRALARCAWPSKRNGAEFDLPSTGIEYV
jgi:hypothetical protein